MHRYLQYGSMHCIICLDYGQFNNLYATIMRRTIVVFLYKRKCLLHWGSLLHIYCNHCFELRPHLVGEEEFGSKPYYLIIRFLKTWFCVLGRQLDLLVDIEDEYRNLSSAFGCQFRSWNWNEIWLGKCLSCIWLFIFELELEFM